MILKIVQTGEPVLREKARALSKEEIESAGIQQLIRLMRDTMQDAPGVGLAAPQVGLGLQLAVIEDRAEYHRDIPPEKLSEREREPVPFQAIVNPVIVAYGDPSVEFFEGCLSLAGFSALVPRSTWVRVECLNERAEPVVIEARGWYARILQHEIDHLSGTLYLDRMRPRSFTTNVNLSRFWSHKTVEEIRAGLDAT
jgi:peptide deformylase